MRPRYPPALSCLAHSHAHCLDLCARPAAGGAASPTVLITLLTGCRGHLHLHPSWLQLVTPSQQCLYIHRMQPYYLCSRFLPATVGGTCGGFLCDEVGLGALLMYKLCEHLGAQFSHCRCSSLGNVAGLHLYIM